MNLQSADLVLGLGFVGAAYAGFRQGFVRQLIGLGILVASAFLALDLHAPAAALLKPFLGNQPQLFVDMAGAAAVFLVFDIGANLVASFFYSHVPFMQTSHLVDEVLGLALSLGLRVLEVSIFLIILDSFFQSPLAKTAASYGLLGGLDGFLKDSVIAGALRDHVVPIVLALVGPFIPAEFRGLVHA